MACLVCRYRFNLTTGDRNMKTLKTGSYSHGTLRACDLASTLADMLRDMQHDDSALLADLDAIAEHGDCDDLDECDALDDSARDALRETLESADEMISDAMDVLQDYAPPFCYVGFHEGDGSDLGVWFNHDAFEEACRDGEILKLSDSSELDDMPKADIAAFDYIAIVSDHGNVSLYTVKVSLGDEVFSIV
jgi:hypothetical protein